MDINDFPIKMRVIPPLSITDSILTSSSAYETAPTAWSSGTTYAVGDIISVAGSAGLKTVYKSLLGSNLNHAPASSPTYWKKLCETYQVYAGGTTYAADDYVIDTTAHLVYQSLVGSNVGNALTDTTKWLEIGPTNRWAMFDLTTSQATVFTEELTIVLTPGTRIDSIGLDGLVGNEVEITQTVGTAVHFHEVIDLNTRPVFGYWDYFFEPFTNKKSIVRFNIPPFTDGVLTITIRRTSGNVECAGIAIGRYQILGSAERQAVVSGLNFSTVNRDFAGQINTLVQRRTVPKTTQRVIFEKERAARLLALKELLNAQPAFWVGIDDDSNSYFEGLQMTGIYTVFDISLEEEDYGFLNLELESI